MASSTSKYNKYDVFLNFRGEDTRQTFTSHLYEAICRSKIITPFIDEDLERGHEISPSLSKAIEQSNVSIIIFSTNYASSSWCLDELVKIIECKNNNGQFVLPVFYNISPSVVRTQCGVYGDAFAKHEANFMPDVVQRWRDALREAADLSGFHSQNFRFESELVKKIVASVLAFLGDPRHLSLNDLKGLPGLDKHIDLIELLLHIGSEDVRFVGIWGMGGIGKTTIAEAAFYKFSSEFEASDFVPNVSEQIEKHGLHDLRKKFLSNLLGEDIIANAPNLGFGFMKKRLRSKKVLLVLDDVNDRTHLEFLVGAEDDFFGTGSRVIVTSRNRHVLIRGDTSVIYDVKPMDIHEALQLFCLNAFKQNHPLEDFMELSLKVVEYADGLPLALKILGSFLHRKRKGEWESTLEKLEEIPDKNVMKILKLSYDGLDDKEKAVFLDITCFHKGKSKKYIEGTLKGCGFHTSISIDALIERSLVYFVFGDIIMMHSMIEQMGRDIVRQESIDEPGKRSRLWNMCDVRHVLKNTTGTGAVQCIAVDICCINDICSHPAAFSKMYNLRLFVLYESQMFESYALTSLPEKLRRLCWSGFSLKSLPMEVYPNDLFELIKSFSIVQQLLHRIKLSPTLKHVVPSYFEHINIIRDFSGFPYLRKPEPGRWRLVQDLASPSSFLKRLSCVNVNVCVNLRELSVTGIIESLHAFFRQDVLEDFPLSMDKVNLGRLQAFNLNRSSCSSLRMLPSSIYNLESPQIDDRTSCLSLEELMHPSFFSGLEPSLQIFDVLSRHVPKILEHSTSFSRLTYLSLSGTDIVTVPTSIKQLKMLAVLCLNYCKRLQCIPELPTSLESLYGVDCPSLLKMSASRSPIKTTGGAFICSTTGSRNFLLINCLKLDESSYCNVKLDAHRQAIYWLNQKFTQTSLLVYPGTKVPCCFPFQAKTSSVEVRIRPSAATKIVGAIVCAVVGSVEGARYPLWGFGISCKIFYDTERHGKFLSCDKCWLSMLYYEGVSLEDDHVFVWRLHNLSTHRSFTIQFLLPYHDSYVQVKECAVRPIYECGTRD